MVHWNKFDENNLPPFEEEFLVLDDEKDVFKARLQNVEKFGIGWWGVGCIRGYISGVTHYAELNLPGEVDQ